MAIRQIPPGKEQSKDRTKCPKCGKEALIIDSKLVQWITCPECKFKKLVRKEDKGVKVVFLKWPSIFYILFLPEKVHRVFTLQGQKPTFQNRLKKR